MANLLKKKKSRKSKDALLNSKKERSKRNRPEGKKTHVNATQTFETAIFMLFTLLVVVICFLGQKPKGTQVLLNQPAPYRIVAEFPFEYASEAMLKRKIDSVSARVPPVFKRTFEPFQQFSEYINSLNTYIAKARIEYETKPDSAVSTDDKKDKDDTLEAALEKTIRSLTKQSQYNVNPETILQFTKMTNPKERSALTKDALNVLKSIFEDGVFSNINTGESASGIAVVQLLDEAGNQNLPYARSQEDALVALRIRLDALSGNRETSRILFDIFRHGLSENLIYNEKATKEATKVAIRNIPPQIIRFSEGDTLIEPGQIATEKHIESLSAYRNEERIRGNNSLLFNPLFLERFVLTLLLLLAVATCIKYGLPTFYRSNHSLAIAAVSILLNLILIRLIIEVGYNVLSSSSPVLAILPYSLPYTFAPIIVAALVGTGPAIVSALILAVTLGILQNNSIEFLLITFLSGVVGSFIAANILKRVMLVRAGTMAGLTSGIAVLILGFMENLPLIVISQQALISVIVGTLTGVVAVGILPMFEQLFKITTGITLLELTDFNHPLLRRMQVEAPGTYHHSLMVANLSENAAAEIGANPLLCRVCCLFHDIGKLVKPEYFTENQREGINPHTEKNPSMSALVIKAHVKEGVELARKHKLPKVIIDVIRQHHGTGLIRYFYYQAQEAQKKQTEPADCDKPTTRPPEGAKVDESTYRYDGPRPSFKESAIIFFADSVEAASRCLKKVTQPALEELIDQIISSRIADGQLDECPLTFQELHAIKSSFTYTLLNMLHSRVEYPKEKLKDKGDKEPAMETEPATPNNESVTTAN